MEFHVFYEMILYINVPPHSNSRNIHKQEKIKESVTKSNYLFKKLNHPFEKWNHNLAKISEKVIIFESTNTQIW